MKKVKVTLKMTKREKKLAKSYAMLHAMTVKQAFMRALFELIEDEYDAAIADLAYEEFIASGEKARPIEELWRELDEKDD